MARHSARLEGGLVPGEIQAETGRRVGDCWLIDSSTNMLDDDNYPKRKAERDLAKIKYI